MPIYLDQTLAQGALSLVPAGTVAFFAGATAPAGWLVRDGSLLVNGVTNYPQLFAQIGYTYGGAGNDFNLPDDRGLALAGDGLGTALPGLTNHTLGAAFGEELHTMLQAELATHTHVQNAHNHIQDPHNHIQDPHTHSVTDGGHNHIQDPHNHIQDPHTHVQDPHTHVQDSHNHGIATTTNTGSGGGGFQYIFSTSTITFFTDGTTATNQNTTATNQNTTATNQSTTATNQSATTGVSVDPQTPTNQAATATNQSTTAVNQNTGSSTPFNVIQPTRYYLPIIKY